MAKILGIKPYVAKVDEIVEERAQRFLARVEKEHPEVFSEPAKVMIRFREAGLPDYCKDFVNHNVNYQTPSPSFEKPSRAENFFLNHTGKHYRRDISVKALSERPKESECMYGFESAKAERRAVKEELLRESNSLSNQEAANQTFIQDELDGLLSFVWDEMGKVIKKAEESYAPTSQQKYRPAFNHLGRRHDHFDTYARSA